MRRLCNEMLAYSKGRPWVVLAGLGEIAVRMVLTPGYPGGGGVIEGATPKGFRPTCADRIDGGDTAFGMRQARHA